MAIDIELRLSDVKSHNKNENRKAVMRYIEYEGDRIQHFKYLISCVQWSMIFGFHGAAQAFTMFWNIFMDIFNCCFPIRVNSKKNVGSRMNKNGMVKWYNNELLKMKLDVISFYNVYKYTGKSSDHQTYKRIRNQYKYKIRETKKVAYSKYINDSTNISKATWTLVKSDFMNNMKNNKIDHICESCTK